MARRKETIWQNDFGLGAVRPEVAERDDNDLVLASVKEALNTVSLSTGQLEGRPGLAYVKTTTAVRGFDVDLGGGRAYHLLILPTGYELLDAAGATVTSGTVSWATLTGVYGSPSFADLKFWVVPDADTGSIIIGSQNFPMQVLSVDGAGTWSFAPLAYLETANGAPLMPFYPHYKGVTLQASDRTGSVTLTAVPGIWTDAHEGIHVRFNGRALRTTTRVSASVMNATVIDELPTAYSIGMASVSGFKVGDVVEDSVLGGRAIVTGRTLFGNLLFVQAVENWSGFAVGNDIVGPDETQEITSLTAISGTQAFDLWDMQMFNPVHGYPGWGARHKGRLYLCDQPTLPQTFAASEAGRLNSFGDGPDDADAFVESIGTDTGGSLKYMISTGGDLLFFTTRGCFYQFTRDGSPITPTTIAPVPFSRIGCAEIEPALLDDGVVFVDALGQQVMAAVLTGDVYKQWTTRSVSKYHSHLIVDPVRIGATPSGSERPEQFVYVVLADGTMAVAQWDRDEGRISWRPWETAGDFVSPYEAAGKIYALVDRMVDGSQVRFLERFTYGLHSDACTALAVSASALTGAAGQAYFGGTTALATHLAGEVASIYFEGWDYGDREIDVTGRAIDDYGNQIPYGPYEGIVQVGLPFTIRIVPWSRRSSRTQYATRDIKRVIDILVTVQDTGLFSILGDGFNRIAGGDDLSLPPPLRSRQVRVARAGNASFEDMPITRTRPGPFRLLKIGYKVTV